MATFVDILLDLASESTDSELTVSWLSEAATLAESELVTRMQPSIYGLKLYHRRSVKRHRDALGPYWPGKDATMNWLYSSRNEGSRRKNQ